MPHGPRTEVDPALEETFQRNAAHPGEGAEIANRIIAEEHPEIVRAHPEIKPEPFHFKL